MVIDSAVAEAAAALVASVAPSGPSSSIELRPVSNASAKVALIDSGEAVSIVPSAGSELTSDACARAAPTGVRIRRTSAIAGAASHGRANRADRGIIARYGSRNRVGARLRARGTARPSTGRTRCAAVCAHAGVVGEIDADPGRGAGRTTTSIGAGACITPAAGAASTRTLPAGTATRYEPSEAVVVLAIWRPPASRTM